MTRRRPWADAVGAPRAFAVPRTEAGLRQMAVALARALDALNPPRKVRFRTELVAEEIVSNLVKYGGGGDDLVHIDLAFDNGGLRLGIEDETRPWNPEDAADPVPPRSLAEAIPGGLGLSLVRKSADGLSYTQTKAGRNRLEAVFASEQH